MAGEGGAMMFFVSFLTLFGVYLVFNHLRRRAQEQEREERELAASRRRAAAAQVIRTDDEAPTVSAVERRSLFAKAIPSGVVLKTSDAEVMGDFGDGKSIVKLDESACAICLVEYEHNESIRKSQHCSHVFHDKCIFAWLVDQQHDDCPCCRRPFLAIDEEMGVADTSPSPDSSMTSESTTET